MALALDTPDRDTRRRRTRRPGIASVTLVPAAILVLLAVLGPVLVPFSPIDVVDRPDLPPGGAHWFGTDSAGMDVFSRTIAATRNNLLIGLITTVLATSLGILIGLVVGMNESRRGPVGTLARGVSRALDLVQAVPAIIIGLVLIAFFGASIPSLTVALTVCLLPNQARLVRAEVLRVRGEAYLDAARVSGDSELVLIAKHVLPNSSWPALENASLVFGSAIVLTAGLGFLGVGLHPPTPEWGSMIAIGAPGAASGRWWSALFPAVALALTVFAVSGVGRRLFGDD
ncbi:MULTISPECIES: ABC transporter permease [Pseudonocardia]|uniref:Peptide/nickel transport system permease protein n=1 Tax=Pseudonocardia oroxyli TaxID=366584 RepID=A0A1G7ZET5_PSEOR|nr:MULTISPECIES: ABC transporter permease [Pseudonocardia]MCF7553802.1 ABC transporter permease [Pseudonocardia sp. WMMC193]SDH07077.1 peptide/nickel transport system permease protein [Pseudonocardia oroxyli]